jgi:hypothetical protein
LDVGGGILLEFMTFLLGYWMWMLICDVGRKKIIAGKSEEWKWALNIFRSSINESKKKINFIFDNSKSEKKGGERERRWQRQSDGLVFLGWWWWGELKKGNTQ